MRLSIKVAAIGLVTLSTVACQQAQSPAAPSSLGSSPALQFASIGGSAAEVVAINTAPGSASFDLIVSIPLSVDSAARKGNAPFAIRAAITYVSTNNTTETLIVGPVLIRNTLLLSSGDGLATIQTAGTFGVLPGANPSFSTTAEVVRM